MGGGLGQPDGHAGTDPVRRFPGIVTGKNLTEHILTSCPPAVWAYWVQAEIIAMATDPFAGIYRRGGWASSCCWGHPAGRRLHHCRAHQGILMLQSLRPRSHWNSRWAACCLFVAAAAYLVELVFSRPHLPSLLGCPLPGLPNGDAVYPRPGVLGRP